MRPRKGQFNSYEIERYKNMIYHELELIKLNEFNPSKQESYKDFIIDSKPDKYEITKMSKL